MRVHVIHTLYIYMYIMYFFNMPYTMVMLSSSSPLSTLIHVCIPSNSPLPLPLPLWSSLSLSLWSSLPPSTATTYFQD